MGDHDRLAMLALGIVGDHPVDAEQPPLPDGIHLRWAPAQDVGFPWYGFYLFRRESEASHFFCLSRDLRRFEPGTTLTPQLQTRTGTLSSPKPLVFTDAFAPAGVVEVDLRAPVRFDLPRGIAARDVNVRIGFPAGKVTRTCVDFRDFSLGNGPNPRTEKGAVFTVEAIVTPPAAQSAIAQASGSPHGLRGSSRFESSVRITIALPCPATRVDLTITNPGAARIEGFDAAGNSAGVQTFAALALQAGEVRVSGKAITKIVVENAGIESPLIHEVCWECPDATSTGRAIDVNFDSWPVGTKPNPFTEQDVRFEVSSPVGQVSFPGGQTVPVASFASFVQFGIPPTGLRGPTIDIQLPCATTHVTMRFSRTISFTIEPPVHIEAFNEDGSLAKAFDDDPTVEGMLTFVIDGAAIRRIHFETRSPNALLHEISFQCGAVAAAPTPIKISGFSGPGEVVEASASGAPGEVVLVTLPLTTTITALTFSSGNASLVDICYRPESQTDTFGWQEVPGFQYPTCLPVADTDYPCANKPATPSEAATLALSRVTYQAPVGWDQQFPQLHDELVTLVHGGPTSTPMPAREHPAMQGQSLSTSSEDVPSIPEGLRPLDLVLLASLHPAMAQMLGLYFADQSVLPNVAYDYLLLADQGGILGGTADAALDWIAFSDDREKVDMELVHDQTAAVRPTIAPPAAPLAYALPGMATRAIDGTMQNGVGNVGLGWPLPPDSAQPDPDRIIFYYPKRASLGLTAPSSQPALADYNVPLRPLLVSEPDDPEIPQRSSDWPPWKILQRLANGIVVKLTVPLYTVDGNLPEGWYSYRLAGQDLFGRHSVLGPPSEWYQWDPPQDIPAPWYYQPTGYRSIHPYAVALLDKIPPPPPLGVEAWALDPLDRWLIKDQRYNAWRALDANRVGLRVSWRWTLMQQIQAPDTTQFRIYYQPGRWNAVLGRVDSVTAASATESHVDLDFADSRAAGSFTGTRLRVGNDDFAVIGSQPGAKLRLHVKNIGANKDVVPTAGKLCTIAIPEGHSLWVDTGQAKSWAERLVAVPYDPPGTTFLDISTVLHISTVLDISKDVNDLVLSDENATAIVNGATIHLPVHHPAPFDLSGIQPWIDHVQLGGAFYPIVRFSAAALTVTLASAPSVSSPAAWAIGRPAREYDLFLDAPDVGAGHPFEPSLAEPSVFAQIAVSASDDKPHVADTFPGGTLLGNESRLSPSATVYRVRQKPPDPPELPDLPERLWATPADYHNRSYTTFRFNEAPNLRIHILRALDDSLLQRDWLIRETRKALDPVDPTAASAKSEHLAFYPDWPAATAASQRQAAATAINALATGASYSTLSNDAWDVLALLPGNEAQPDHAALEQRDRFMRALRGGHFDATDPTLAPLFPPTWTPATRAAAAAELNAVPAPGPQAVDPSVPETHSTAYAALSDNALRLLAALPGNEAVFTQVTLAPVDMAAPEIRDERRPDDDETYAPQTVRRAYTDTLPGRATNRFFYRAMYVDGAQNQSALSVPGPPVYLRKVEPPRAPVITGVVGGDGTIDLAWANNRENDLLEYRVYRAESEEGVSDIRSMTAVASIPAVTANVPDQIAEILWRDSVIVRGKNYWYRIVAVDNSGNVSAPTAPIRGTAFRLSPLPPPEWIEAAWRPSNDAVELRWAPSENGLSHLVQRRVATRMRWDTVSNWLTFDMASFVDQSASPGEEYFYRLRARDESGNTSSTFITRRVPAQE
jgi:hypothetical protein